MKRPFVSRFSVCTALALGVLLALPVEATYDSGGTGDPQGVFWENSRIRLTRLSVEPGAAIPAGGDRILIFFTADPDGKMPAEAVWQAASAGAIQNRGPVRLEAIAIELKDGAPGTAAGMPAEAPDPGEGVSVTPLIDNPRMLVAKHRYAPITFGAPLHFHAEDVFVVYLRGGHSWRLGGLWGSSHVRRGDVDVVPANTFHRLGNAGGDPLELLVIVPR